MNLVFKFTKDVLGWKTQTRRVFKEYNLFLWQMQWDKGNIIHQAWDKHARNGGNRIGKFVLTARPFSQTIREMTKEDLKKEAVDCKTPQEFADKYFKGKIDQQVMVLTFKYLGDEGGETDVDRHCY